MTNTISKVYHNGTEYEFKDTTYSAGTGLSLSGTEFRNAGVLSVGGSTGAVKLKTINSTSLVGDGDITVSGGHNYNWVTKSGTSFKLDLRSLISPTANFTVNVPDTIEDGMEYVLRCVNETAYTMTLGTGFTNPFGVDLTLSNKASDQFVFLAINGELELQPAPVLN